MPPIRAEPCAAIVSGNNRFAPSAASCTCCRITPASTVIAFSTASTPRTRAIRSSDRITGDGRSLTCPPTSPVPPP